MFELITVFVVQLVDQNGNHIGLLTGTRSDILIDQIRSDKSPYGLLDQISYGHATIACLDFVQSAIYFSRRFCYDLFGLENLSAPLFFGF